MVGTSGATTERCADVTANARSLPALRCGTAVAMLSIATSSVPPSSSGIIWPLPRYGMCCIFTPAMVLNISPEMCCDVPLPAEPNEYFFGFGLHQRDELAQLLAGTLGCSSSTLGCVAYIVIGSKLFTGS